MTLAVFLLGIACALIQNVESDSIACPKHVIGKMGGSVTITCRYSTIPKANMHTRKYFCREGGWPGKCKVVITSTSGYLHENYFNRALIEENNIDGLIIITIFELSTTDEGTYICGLGTDVNRIKALFTVAVTEDSVIPNEAQLMYGQVRGGVNFRCEFENKYIAKRKYLCKIGKHVCRNIIDSSGATDTAYNGRVLLIVDDRNPASFTVKMIQLRNEDAGMFSCGVGTSGVDGETMEFDLRISEETDIPQGSRSLSTRLGGSVSAQCNYNPKKSYTNKFWCKLEDSVCNPLIKMDGFVNSFFEGRLVIHDDPTNGSMQVLMNQITKDDEGWYWCVLTDENHDHTSAVHIRISEEIPEGLTGSKIIHVNNGETAKIPCTYPCRFKSHQKYWCKWNNNNCKEVTSYVDDDENGLSVSCENQKVVLTIESVSSKDSGWYWCGVKKSGRYGETIAVQLKVEATRDIRARAQNNNGNKVIDTPPSISDSKHNIMLAAILSVCAAVLVISGAFVIIRLKRKKESDLVSVGSYRTNISMSDLDNGIGKDNPAVIDTQETDISHSKDGGKIKKKGSQEDLDYSSFLISHNGTPNEENTA